MVATELANSDRASLRVGSWPGPSFTDNQFIPIFCDALEKNGATVEDIRDLKRIDPRRIDVLQLHWAEQVFWRGRAKAFPSIVAALLAIRRARKSNVPVFWLVHNLKPHASTPLTRVLWAAYTAILSRMVDGYVSLSPGTLPIIERQFKKHSSQTGFWFRHPRFDVSSELESKEVARARWATPRAELLLAFVGSIEPYKGVNELISAMKKVDPCRLGLVIGGRTAPLYASSLTSLVAGSSNIDVRARRLEDAEFEGLIRAADYVVLPFTNTLHSSSIVHALSLGRPVVTPRTAYAADLADIVGSEWVRLYDGNLNAELLGSLSAPPQGDPDLTMLSADLAGRQLVDFYCKAVTRARSTGTNP